MKKWMKATVAVLAVFGMLDFTVASLGGLKDAFSLDRGVIVSCDVVLETGVGCVAYVKPPPDFAKLVDVKAQRRIREHLGGALLHITLTYIDEKGHQKAHRYGLGELYGSRYEHQVKHARVIKKVAVQDSDGMYLAQAWVHDI